jgi:hypothetical protein
VSSAAGPWPAADDSQPRSRRGPGVKPFTPDPAGSSVPDPLATGMIATQRWFPGATKRDQDAQRA